MFAVTPRLVLRPGWPEDAEALTRAIAHADVVRNLAHAPWPYTLADAESFLAMPVARGELRCQIFTRDAAFALIGGVALIPVAPGVAEIGYWLTPAAWGRGYASEAGRAAVAIARHALRLERLIGRHFVDNPGSGRVLRKLGFRETGASRLHSVARGHDAPSIELVLELGEDVERPSPMPIAMPLAA